MSICFLNIEFYLMLNQHWIDWTRFLWILAEFCVDLFIVDRWILRSKFTILNTPVHPERRPLVGPFARFVFSVFNWLFLRVEGRGLDGTKRNMVFVLETKNKFVPEIIDVGIGKRVGKKHKSCYRVCGMVVGDKQIRHREHGRVHHAGRPRKEYHAELVPRDGHQKHAGGVEQQAADVHSFGSVRQTPRTMSRHNDNNNRICVRFSSVKSKTNESAFQIFP